MHRHCPLTKTSANCRIKAIDWLERDKKIMDYAAESLKLHYKWQGKIEVTLRAPLETADDLSLAYTPGVAEPCLEIQKDVSKS